LKRNSLSKNLLRQGLDKLQGLKVLIRLNLPVEKKKEQPVASSDQVRTDGQKRPRKRLPNANAGQKSWPRSRWWSQPQGDRLCLRTQKAEPTEKEIQEQIRATLAKLSGGTRKVPVLNTEEKNVRLFQMLMMRECSGAGDSKTLKLTEFISANDLAS
jgi:translation initiation factor IF-2